MESLSAFANAYVDVNILMILALAAWLVTARALRWAGLGHGYLAQLRGLRVAFLVVLASPLMIAGLMALAPRAGDLAQQVNLSEFIVGQYLQGNFQMDPSRLETILAAKRQIVTGDLGSFGLAALALLATGFAVFAVRLVASMLKLKRVLDDSFAWRSFRRLDLRLSDTTTVPFSTRSLRRRIVVFPAAMLADPEDLRIALGHELQHLRQHDVDWEIAMEVLKPLFFWNPAFHLWRRQIETLRELCCDRQVIARKGYDVATYCQCLLRVCHNSLRRRRLFAVQVPVVGLVQTENRLFGHRSADTLRRRLLSLIEDKADRHPWAVSAGLMLLLPTLILTAALSFQRPGDWSQERLMLSTIINLDRLADLNARSLATRPAN